MPSFNRVVLIGNLTRDPELRYVADHTAVSDVGLAINERVKRNGEYVVEPVFVDVTIWGRMAEVAVEYLTKGSPVLIEGRLKYEAWERDGHRRSKLKVVCDRMQMLGTGSKANENTAKEASPDDGASATEQDISF